MATPIYRNALKSFWRRMENADVVITAASPDTYSGTVHRFPWTTGSSIPAGIDRYFYGAGQALIRVLMALTYDEVYKISPSLVKNKSDITLTTGVGAITENDIARVFDRQKVYTSGGGAIVRIARMLDTWDRDEVINGLNQRKITSTTNPYFEVIGTVINVYPTSFTKIDLRYIKSCPLQVSSEAVGVLDPFPEILQDIWVDMACRIAAGDMKDSLELIISKQLQEKFAFLNRPKQKTPNTKEIVG